MKKSIITILVLLLISVSTQAQSFFSEGGWIKIGVKEQGLYKLDKNYLQTIGVDVSNPESIAVFGGDGDMLPQLNSATKNIEPQEVPTLLHDEGVFQDDFALFFYSEGAKKITLDEDGLLNTRLNIYTDTVFYYVGIVEGTPLRIEEQINPLNNLESTVTIYNHREEEDVNLFTSGRVWLSDRMDSKTLSHTIETPIYNLQSDVNVRYDFLGSSSLNSIYYNFSVGDSVSFSNKLLRSTSGYGVKIRSTSGEQIISKNLFSDDHTSFTVALDNGGDLNSYGYINYLSWQYETDAAGVQEGIPFYSLGRSKKITFQDNHENHLVWTYNLNNGNQYLIKGVSDGNDISYSIGADTLELLLVDLSDVNEPEFKGEVVSSDLSSFKSDVDLLVVYHKSLESEVLRYQAHKEQMGIKTSIAEVGDVFDQYSNGKKDISAIRNYVKHIYDNTTDFKYLVLFGDCSYDYKDRIGGNTNMIPVYESEESYHNVQTFSSDDYYGFLEDNEGSWVEGSRGNHTLDIAIGRFPTRDIEEAKIVVDKIIGYETINEKGDWKNNIIFVADDVDEGGALHVGQANDLIDIVESSGAFMEINKQYIDSYERPEGNVTLAKEQLLKAIEDGAMFVNYTGHGSEYIWMEEEVLNIQDINSLDNKDKLAVFITATCEFGRYDNPKITSGAESLFINEAGAISLVTTTRPVYSSSNFAINTSFYRKVFDEKTDGKFNTLGEIFKETKNSSLNGVFNRNFSLMGDPTISLKLANNKVIVEKIDGQDAISFSDTILPGQVVDLKGVIVDEFGTFDPEFNGFIEVSVFEAAEIKSTLGYSDNEKVSFIGDPLTIYSAVVQVINGEYRLEVALPMEISNSFGGSKVFLYAYDSTGKEAYGVLEDIVIGGNSENVENELPNIDFTIVNENTVLKDGFIEIKLDLTDDYGILMSDEVIGKETVLVLNGDKQNPNIINDVLELVDGSARNVSTVLKYDILANQENNFEVQTWDIHGQSSSKEFSVNFEHSNEIDVFPNPIEDDLHVMIEKIALGQSYDLEIKVYNHLSRIIYEGNLATDSNKYVNELKLKPEELGIKDEGLYYYDINIRYLNNDSVFNKKGKLIKL